MAAFHEDVDVVAGFGEVDEVDDIGVLDLLADDDFRLDALDDVGLEFLLGGLVSLLMEDLCSGRSTCLSSYCLDITLQASNWPGFPFGQAANTWL